MGCDTHPGVAESITFNCQLVDSRIAYASEMALMGIAQWRIGQFGNSSNSFFFACVVSSISMHLEQVIVCGCGTFGNGFARKLC